MVAANPNAHGATGNSWASTASSRRPNPGAGGGGAPVAADGGRGRAPIAVSGTGRT